MFMTSHKSSWHALHPRLPAFSMSVVLKVSLKLPEVLSVKSGYIDDAAVSSVVSPSPPVAAMVVVAWGAHPHSASASAATAAITAMATSRRDVPLLSCAFILFSFLSVEDVATRRTGRTQGGVMGPVRQASL